MALNVPFENVDQMAQVKTGLAAEFKHFFSPWSIFDAFVVDPSNTFDRRLHQIHIMVVWFDLVTSFGRMPDVKDWTYSAI